MHYPSQEIATYSYFGNLLSTKSQPFCLLLVFDVVLLKFYFRNELIVINAKLCGSFQISRMEQDGFPKSS